MKYPNTLNWTDEPIANSHGTGCGSVKMNNLAYIWKAMKSRMPERQPLQWSTHEDTFKFLEIDADDLPEGIMYGGYFTGAEYMQKILEADILLILFNGFSPPESYYAKYSIPSRLSEACTVGLPSVLLGTEDSADGAFIERHQIGQVSSLFDVEQTAETILDYLQQVESRRSDGARGRVLAASAFRREMHKERIQKQLIEAVEHG